MASHLPHQEEDRSCPACHHVVKHSIHSYCKDCLQEWWTEKPANGCPVCKTRSSRDQHSTNLGLKNQCRNLLEEKYGRASSETSEGLCTVHGEKFVSLCLNDEQLDSEKRAGHTFRSVDEASRHCQQELQESLKPLKEKLDVFEEVKVKYDQTENRLKVQARNTEAQIKEQFKNLHQFLQDEEEARIATLREEEAQKSQEIKKNIEGLSREMATLSNTIRAAEDQLRANDRVSFLHNYKATVKRVQLTQQDPQPISGVLIDEAKHLSNLAFRVWEKMKEIVIYTPVILNPNTAESGLILSEDLTSVRHAELQQLSEKPERLELWPTVLGSEGFNSGSHSWDVEVGQNRCWALGVSAESNQRTGNKGGRHWMIGFCDGKYTVVSSPGSVTDLSLNHKAQKIRVQLDWNRGMLSFSDADDTTHLHTFTQTFTERLFPFIGNGDVGGSSLKVLPGKHVWNACPTCTCNNRCPSCMCCQSTRSC